ncbi:hypothetical protein EU527_18805 [Candidatus Thorarchaeota archaeon]|nr:MAG: hypothetical protein EU527_18805 [Candidatus Thorarchaeota archaeon]
MFSKLVSNERAGGMYEEIDTSGQGKWISIAAIGFIITIGIVIVRFFMIPLDEPPYIDSPEMVIVIGFTPFLAVLFGSLFGFLKKRATKINPDRLEFMDDARPLGDFGKVYYEGDFETGDLGGHPLYGCGWAILLIVSIFPGFILLFTINTFLVNALGVLMTSFTAVFYVAGYISAFRGSPIATRLVKDPLHFRITKYLSKMDVLDSIKRCDIVKSIVVKFKVGKGHSLKVIDDIHVFAEMTTDPPLEIEITIEKMENIGPEYTYFLSSSDGTRKEESIEIDGKTTFLTIDEVDMRSFVRMRYNMGTVRARWNLGTPESLCDLMHALLDEIKKYEDFQIVTESLSSDIDEP